MVCLVRVAKLVGGSFVLNGNWRFWGQAALRKAKDLTERTQRKAEGTEKEGEIPAAAGPTRGTGGGLPSQKTLRASRMTVLGAWSEAQGRPVENSDGRALDRPLVMFEIFTDSSSACGVRNAKGRVCTGLVPGEGRRHGCKTNGNAKDSRLKGKSRRLRQFQKQCQRRAQQAAPLPIQHLHQEQRLPGSMKPNRPLHNSTPTAKETAGGWRYCVRA